MAIGTRKKRVLAAKDFSGPGSTTHFPNDEKMADVKSDVSVKNNQDPQDLLIDPDDESGSTHFRNEEKLNDKSKGNPATAAAKKTTAAEVDVEHDEADGYTQDLSALDEGLPKKGDEADLKASTKTTAAEDCDDKGPQATTHSPNGDDVAEPAEGYLTNAELEDLDEEFEDEEEVDADALADDAGQNPQQSLLDVTDELEEVDAEMEMGDDEHEFTDDMEEDDDMAEADVDSMPILDVDDADDDGDDVVFAAVGNRLHVIKGNRIVASMGKKLAVKASVEDLYLSEQFQDASYAEFSKHGLRAGLRKMGFALATVDVAKNELINKRVEAKAKKVTAAVRRTAQASNDALGQCLAIAAVGINRQYFKDSRNELRAALESELTAAGVRGARSLLKTVFAKHGVSYAKDILTLANSLVTKPEEVRNAYAEALDLTSDGEVEELDDLEGDEFGQPANPDFMTEADQDEDFVEEFEEEIEAPETVHAALARPIHRRQVVKAASYSSGAQAVLAGTAKLPFAQF